MNQSKDEILDRINKMKKAIGDKSLPDGIRIVLEEKIIELEIQIGKSYEVKNEKINRR